MTRSHARRVSFAPVSTVDWRFVFLLGAVALVRPILSIRGLSDGQPWVPVLTTVVITALWVLVVVRLRVERPVLTLALAGGMYGCFALLLGSVIQGGLSVPVFAIPFVIATNLVWGALAGGIAAGIDRTRDDRRRT